MIRNRGNDRSGCIKTKERAADWTCGNLTLLRGANTLFQVYFSWTSLEPQTVTTDDQLVPLVAIETWQTLLLKAINNTAQPKM